MKNFKRVLSMLIVVVMVAAMFVPTFANDAVEVTASEEAYVTSDGATIKVHNLFDIKDVSLAEGEWSTYREVKNNLLVSVTSKSNKISENVFTYVVTHGGMHTVAIRYNDGTQVVLTHEIVVTDPVFTTNGLQIIVSNLGDDVKTIRTAAGTHDSVQAIKKTEGSRSFSQNHIKYAESFLLQYREEGPVTVVVDYVHGYRSFFYYDVAKYVPSFVQDGNSVTIGIENPDDLYVIRYAAGEYATSTEIKKAPGSQYKKAADLDENGYITISDLAVGTHTFCVQFTDDSYNIYVVTVAAPKAYTITFDADGGVMPEGALAVLPIDYQENYKEAAGYDYPVPTLDGYDFAGWYWEEYNYTLTEGDWNGGYYAITWSITVVALWEEAAPALGSYENPYLVYVDGDRLAVTVPAGADAYVKADDPNGSVLTVGYATANTYMVNYVRQTVYPEGDDNAASFTMMDGFDTFCVTNTGDADIVLYMALAAGAPVDTTGTWDNPEVLELTEQFGALRAWSEAALDEGNQGRWYKVTAPADGKLAINVSAYDADYNTVGWQFYTIKNSSVYSDTYTSLDYEYETIFVDVKAGDEVIISAATFNPENVWNNPCSYSQP